jgi:hypothetical protein
MIPGAGRRNITSVADDKTRVLTAAEAAGLVVEKPRFTDGKIVFFCPNGHRLVVAEVHGGKRGRCDKAGCGVAVVIPVRPPEEQAAFAGLAEAVEPATDEPAEESAAEPTEEAAASGQAIDEAAEEPAAERGDVVADATDGAPQADGDPAEAGEDWQFGGGADDATVEPAVDDVAAASAAWGGFEGAEPESEAFDNPTARLVARLWVEREHGGVVELHLTGGSVILPEWYESRWSRGTHGLFASQAPDGSITLTAVAWDSIQKVVVRQVKGLPDGMFE